MIRDDLLQRIPIDPAVCFGKPCICGTRIWVSLIIENLAEGVSEEEILEAYPSLTPTTSKRRWLTLRSSRATDHTGSGRLEVTRLKLDENLEVRLAPWLRSLGHDAQNIRGCRAGACSHLAAVGLTRGAARKSPVSFAFCTAI